MSQHSEHSESVGVARRPRIGWHPVDPVSLVAGVLAVGVALLSLLEVDVDVDGGVVVPLLLLGAGAVGLVAALRRDRDG